MAFLFFVCLFVDFVFCSAFVFCFCFCFVIQICILFLSKFTSAEKCRVLKQRIRLLLVKIMLNFVSSFCELRGPLDILLLAWAVSHLNGNNESTKAMVKCRLSSAIISSLRNRVHSHQIEINHARPVCWSGGTVKKTADSQRPQTLLNTFCNVQLHIIIYTSWPPGYSAV